MPGTPIYLQGGTGGSSKPPPKPKLSPVTGIRQRQLAATQYIPGADDGGRTPSYLQGAVAARAKAQKELTPTQGGLSGNLRGLGESFEKAGPGLVGIVKAAGKEAVSPFTEIARGTSQAARSATGQRVEYKGINRQTPGEIRKVVREQHPLVQMQASSLKHTGERVTHPGQYAEAWRQGQLGNVLLEDFANLALLGGLASAPLRGAAAGAESSAAAARLAEEGALRNVIAGAPASELEAAAAQRAIAETAARRLAPLGAAGEKIQTVTHLGARVGNAPILPIEYAGRALKTLGQGVRDLELAPGLAARLGERYGAEIGTLGEAVGASGIGRAAGVVGREMEARRYLKGVVNEETRTWGREHEHRVQTAAYGAAKGLSPAEDQAATLIASGRLGSPQEQAVLRYAIDTEGRAALEEATRRANQTPTRLGLEQGHTYTPEAVETALRYHEGTLDPEVRAKIDQGLEGRRIMSSATQEAQAEGAKEPIPAEQFGTETLASQTTGHPAVLRRQQALADIEKPIERARQRVETAAERASNRELQVEDRTARGVTRLEQGSEQQQRLEAARVRAAEAADRHWQRADEARLRGDQKAARAAEDAAIRAGQIEEASAAKLQRLVDKRNVEGHVAAEAEARAGQARTTAAAQQRLGVAADEAARNAYLRSAGPVPRETVPAVRAPEPTPIANIGPAERRVARRFGAGLKQEEQAARLGQRSQAEAGKAATAMENVVEATQRHESEVVRAQDVKAAGERKAASIAENANDEAALSEGRAQGEEARLAAMADKTPMRDVGERELGRAVKAGEQQGKFGEQYRVAVKQHEQLLAQKERLAADVDKELAKRMQSLDAMPARYRYAGDSVRQTAEQAGELVKKMRALGFVDEATKLQAMVADLPMIVEDLAAAGVDPIYLPGGRDPWAVEARRKLDKLKVTPGEYSLRERKLRAEQQRQTTLHPTSAAGQAAIAIDEIDRAAKNRTARRVIAERGKTPADFGIDLKAEPGLLAGKGERLVDAMAAEGYAPFDPERMYGDPPITADTIWVPKEIKRNAGHYFAPDGTFETIMKTTFDPVRRAWKHMVLPVSGQWHFNNIVSNAVMNTIGSGSLAWLGEYKQAWKDVLAERRGGQLADAPARLFGLAPEAELRDFIRRSTGRDPNLVMRFLDKSYALNTFFDDVSRLSNFRSEVKRGLRGGLELDAAQKQALNEALKISGDFGNLSEFERAYARRAIPFYTWVRHVTQLVSHLAVTNPIRLVWTLNLANLYAPENSGPFGDSIRIGDQLLNVGGLSPLGTFQRTFGNERGPVAGIAEQLGPEIDIAAAAGLGINLGRGGQPIRTAPGYGNLDQFGNPANTALWNRPGLLGSYVTRQVPLVNTARQFALGRKLAEYDTGQPVLIGGKLVDSTPNVVGTHVGGRLGIAARQLGVPTTSAFDVEGMAAKTAKRKADAAKARARYDKQLAKARKG